MDLSWKGITAGTILLPKINHGEIFGFLKKKLYALLFFNMASVLGAFE